MCYYRTDDGKCMKFFDDKITSYCVDGPCPYDTPTNANRMWGMDREHQIEAIAEALCNWARVGDREGSYIYDLTRCKAAFGVGTMSLDDFKAWGEDRCLEVAAEFADWLRQPAKE